MDIWFWAIVLGVLAVGLFVGSWIKEASSTVSHAVTNWWREQPLTRAMVGLGVGVVGLVACGAAIYLVIRLAQATTSGSLSLVDIANLGPVATATAAIVAFVGVLWSAQLTRRTARELEGRSRREEVMRTMRWAAEMSCSEKESLAKLGVAELLALLRSNLLDVDQTVFVMAALHDTLEGLDRLSAEIEAAGDDVQVIEDE